MEILKLNSIGPNVELLQSVLKKIGFFNYIIDGEFGKQTESAVIQFQKKFGLNSDGIVGNATWDALFPYLNGYTNYIVKSGDSIYSIANKYNTTINAITTANPNIISSNLQINSKIIVPFNYIVPTNISYTYEILNMNINSLKIVYPFLKFGNIGKSVLGRNIPFIKFGNGNKEIFYSASFHANEWICSVLLMKFLEILCKAYVNNTSIYGYNAKNLYNEASVYIVPMVNPDGVDLVTGFFKENSIIYQNSKKISDNYPTISFPSGWKANISGIDLNLQFPAGWKHAKQIKFSQGFTTPAPRDFVGNGPLVSSEALAIYNFTISHYFRLIISFHTQGKEIYWQFQNYATEEALKIGTHFSNVSGYELAQVPYNSSFAGYKDWFLQEYRRPGYTIEAGLGSNPLPISQFDKIYKDTLGILVLGILS